MKRILALALFFLTVCPGVFAQGIKDIRINEVLVKNVDNYMDDYGHRSSWIELHNTSHATLDVGGCYLRIESNGGQETIYRIPTGDPKTKISPLGYCVFFCEGTGTKGTLYTNFTLENVESIAFLNASGKGEPVDEIVVDFDKQLPDISIGRMTLDTGDVVFTTLPRTTPNATNDTEPLLPRSEKFRLMDPTGAVMTILAIMIVISVLLLLFLFFKLLGNYMVAVAQRKAAKQTAPTTVEGVEKTYGSPETSEVIAAITLALQMYQDDLHDKESRVLTINKVARAYSPWSSKIYGLTQYPRKK